MSFQAVHIGQLLSADTISLTNSWNKPQSTTYELFVLDGLLSPYRRPQSPARAGQVPPRTPSFKFKQERRGKPLSEGIP